MTVTSKGQARQKQLDFLESMKVFEEVYEDELSAGTHVMSGRWVDTMKTPTMWRSKYTAGGYDEPHSDEGCFAAAATIQGIRMLLERCLDKRDQGHEACVADCTQAFLNAEVREGEQLYAQPPEGWNPKILMDGRRVVWKVRKAMLGLRTSPRRWHEHLSGKLKEHGFFFKMSAIRVCLRTRNWTFALVCTWTTCWVGPSELTNNLLQELSKDMTMRWGMVTDKPQEFLGRSLCRTPQGYTFGVSSDYVTKLCKDFGFGELKGYTLSYEKPDDNDTIRDKSGHRRHRQLLGRLLWLDRPDIKNAVCQLSTHVGTATTRDEINIKRLLRYLIGNPACNMIVGCNLDVPVIVCIPQGSVVVMTDGDWAGNVKDRRSYSGIAVWLKGSVENTWYPVYASSKKQNLVCLSSGESELVALVGGACEGIATRDQWSKLCTCSPGTIVLCTDSSAALGFVKRKGASRRTRHVDTKVHFMQAWAMEPGQRILKVHGNSQQVADCLTKVTTPRAAHRKALGL